MNGFTNGRPKMFLFRLRMNVYDGHFLLFFVQFFRTLLKGSVRPRVRAFFLACTVSTEIRGQLNRKITRTSGYAMVVHGRPQTPKIQVFWGSPSPQWSHSPYILGDTTKPGHVTRVLVWSKSDRRRLRKTLHKQTDRHYENNGHLAVNQW